MATAISTWNRNARGLDAATSRSNTSRVSSSAVTSVSAWSVAMRGARSTSASCPAMVPAERRVSVRTRPSVSFETATVPDTRMKHDAAARPWTQSVSPAAKLRSVVTPRSTSRSRSEKRGRQPLARSCSMVITGHLGSAR